MKICLYTAVQLVLLANVEGKTNCSLHQYLYYILRQEFLFFWPTLFF